MHANELVLAQSLRTRSKPALYYRPCSFTEAQKRVVEDQFRSAKRRIEQEEEDFEKEKQTRLAALDVRYSPKPAAPDKNERDAVPEEADSDKPTGSGSLDTDMAPPPTQQDADATDAMVDETDEKARPGPKPGTASSENHAGHEFHDDKDRGIMVETEEDTVIY
ncbi:hypothetical protein SCUCBS95973_003896 [Sporothrix curviconia]|uniref:Pinin/SDK/MemA protein domain-containing protein n=1 Tax=Sporothrix curviconia TaxID=1260050 RepID=A0ABP0BJ51_9PEZI